MISTFQLSQNNLTYPLSHHRKDTEKMRLIPSPFSVSFRVFRGSLSV